MAEAQSARLSGADYLAWEAAQSGKHEYVAGEVFAMVGASDRHVTIAGNVFAALRAHLRGGPCRAYIADMKLRVDAVDAWFYPDVMVVCEAADLARPQDKIAPVLIVEVLSPSTEAFDRGGKFAAYRQIETLREYLMVDPESGRIELYRREDAGRWSLQPPADPVELLSVDLRLLAAEVFEDAAPGP
ncbi:MAG: Uma2 family endonuclease [Lamprobacter sp.]|uniref:Uma2 family endonuclease n=1 Tax=Lamprobacter sp. TaxID=3100796 RepID=UPI002B259575|nr:Uma2 family endonuclease [Lamprobacter sp.]MEA3642670.1 Uma2 family endonuclease [Lamprobacter sp.]